MSSSIENPDEIFVCMRYEKEHNNTLFRAVVAYDMPSVMTIKDDLRMKLQLPYSFNFSEVAGHKLYVLSLNHAGNTFVNYAFFEAEQVMQFAKLILPNCARLHYSTIPSLELCSQLLLDYYSYPGMCEIVKFSQQCQTPANISSYPHSSSSSSQ